MSNKRKLVVIGNGMAGARAVEDLLARGGAELFDIVMFGEEPYGNYNRIMLSNVLSGSQNISEIFLNEFSWYEQNNIALHSGEKIIKIDRYAKKVLSDFGMVENYDVLLIATGSRPFIPPAEGILNKSGRMRDGVFGFRTIDDCNDIIAATGPGKKVAVIGGGLLGLEAAYGLLNYGCEVHVVHRSDRLMGQQLDATGAQMLTKSMRELGVHVHLNKNTAAVLGDEHTVRGLAFTDGSILECDLVVLSAGIQPNNELGLQAGISVERAIVVNDQMQSPDDPFIYAVGECAQHRGQVYGLVAPLWEQTKVFADVVSGVNPSAFYAGSRASTKLKVMGIDVASMGITDSDNESDEIVQFYEPRQGTYKKLIVRDGRLVGAIMMGDLSKVAFLMQAFERRTPLPDERLSLLFDLGAPSQDASLEEIPDDVQICNCNGITKAQIGAAVAGGCRSGKAVMDATRAGMGCGSCKGLINDVVNWYCGGAAEEDPSVHFYVPGIPLNKPELVEQIKSQQLKSVSSVFDALAGGVHDPGSKIPLASLLNILWAEEYIDERDARFINDRVHGNIQKDGTFSVVPEMPAGITTPSQLRRIADVADKYQIPLVKLTGGQRIDLLGIAKHQLPAVWQDLGMPAGWAWGKSYRTCKSCVGTDYCRFGLGDSMGLAEKIEARFRGLDSPGKLKLATTGCPRNCAEAYVKDVGAVAVGEGKWEIYIGGAAGSHIRKGDLMCTVDSEEDVLLLTGRFLQYYRELAKYKERTHAFIERMGFEKIRAIIVDDSEGIAARLDAEMQRAVDALVISKDPWLEAYNPKTANQFVDQIAVVLED